MNPLRRIAACLNVSFETFLHQVENHEALANCALHEIRRAAAKARVQYFKVKNETEQLTRKIEELGQERRAWVERARRSVGDDNRAMECIKRLSVVEKLIEQVTKAKIKNERVEMQLAADLRKIEEKTQEFRRRRDQLSSREAATNALNILGESSVNSLEELDDIFVRWESKMSSVPGSVSGESHDELEDSFRKEEETEALRTKLREVLGREAE